MNTSAKPNEVASNGRDRVKLFVKIDNPGRIKDIKSVLVDLVPIGGAANSRMYNNGTNGDSIEGDNVFTLWTTVAKGVRSERKKLKVIATNFVGGKGFGAIDLVVK